MFVVNDLILQKVSARCSGQAMKLNVVNATADQISKALGDVPHRQVSALNMSALDDKMATIVVGLEDMSLTEFTCFVSRMNGLRFRNILIFPTKTWHDAKEGEITLWDRIGETMNDKFLFSTSEVQLEGTD